MFFVTGMVVVIYSLQNMRISQHKVVATQYAQQLVTWIRTQKEVDWNSFVSNYTSIVSSTFCFNATPITPPASPPPGTDDCGNNYSLGTPALFKRWATFTTNNQPQPLTQIRIDVTVQWKETVNTYKVPLTTVVTKWE